ncbi:MAG: hypothetical protein Fur005_43300 [Roseiflexaceae bacterium]
MTTSFSNIFGLSQAALDACASEPIHIPGSIQPYGVLLITDPATWTIAQISINCANLLGREPHHLLGMPLSEWFPITTLDRIRTHINTSDAGKVRIFDVVLMVQQQPTPLFCLAHHYQNLVLLELLPVDHEHATSPDSVAASNTPEPANNIQQAPSMLIHPITDIVMQHNLNTTINQFCQAVVEEVRKLTEYDRVMVYQFDDDGNGEVIAEDRAEGLEPFLGLHYPASDIPPQARLLYLRSRVRVLGDIYATAMPIVPSLNPTSGRSPDLSYCLLRSFSPVHLEYLHNMGVRATLTVSIIEQGRLWGMIVCHHRQPKWPNHAMRAASDLLSEVISMQLSLSLHALRAQILTHTQALQHQLIRQMATRTNWVDALLTAAQDLPALFDADGAAICYGQQIARVGVTPSDNDIQQIVLWLQTNVPHHVLISDALSTRNPQFQSISHYASGLIAIEIARADSTYVLWFRREVQQVITWGGRPEEQWYHGEQAPRLHPRRSFAAWQTIMRGRSLPWPASTPQLAETLRSMLVEVVFELVTMRQTMISLDLLRIRRAIESSSEPITISMPDGKLLFVNPAFTKMSGYTLETLEQAGGLSSLFANRLEQEQIETVLQQQQISWHGEIGMRVANGLILPISLMIDQVTNESGQPIGQIRLYTNLLPRRKAEEERRKLDAQLMQTQKLESLGLLAGGIAHDFNNLLTAMLGYANLVLHELPSASPIRESVAQIEVAALRAADLSRQMLIYSGCGHAQIEPINFNHLITEMGSLLNTAITKKISLALNLADHLPHTQADATQIRQVVMNLITNAADAIGQQAGTITISTAMVEISSEQLHRYQTFEPLAGGEYIQLTVSDTGIGMSEATLARIFDPFFTTKFTGRGLGLAAVQGIIRAHKAALRVESQLNVGTTFELLFPIIGILPDQRPVEAPPINRGSGQWIEVIDDDPGVRHFVQRVLERYGYQVLLAEDGQIGIDRLQQHPEPVHAVILDLTMPRMSGIETFSHLQVLQPGIRVLLCSGYTEEEAIGNFGEHGIAGFLQKPFRPIDLMQALERIL